MSNIGSKLCIQHIHKDNAKFEFLVDEQMFTKEYKEYNS